MPIDDRLRARLEELIARGGQIAALQPQYRDPGGRRIIEETFGWKASAMSAVHSVFPDPAHPYRVSADRASKEGTVPVGALT